MTRRRRTGIYVHTEITPEFFIMGVREGDGIRVIGSRSFEDTEVMQHLSGPPGSFPHPPPTTLGWHVSTEMSRADQFLAADYAGALRDLFEFWQRQDRARERDEADRLKSRHRELLEYTDRNDGFMSGEARLELEQMRRGEDGPDGRTLE